MQLFLFMVYNISSELKPFLYLFKKWSNLAMFSKRLLVPILLVALMCLHYTCPLFCAAFEQKLCGNVSTEILADYADTGTTCCHKSETDAENSSESPSQSQTECCETELELILSNKTDNSDTFRETIKQSYYSVVTPYPVQLQSQGKLLHNPTPMKMFSYISKSNISRRGPPYTHS